MPLQKAPAKEMGPHSVALYDMAADGSFGGVIVEADTGAVTHLLSRTKQAAASVGRHYAPHPHDASASAKTEALLQEAYGAPYHQSGVRLCPQPLTHANAHLTSQDGMPSSVRQALMEIRTAPENAATILDKAAEGSLKPLEKGITYYRNGNKSP